ncbi:hypothetical protein ACLBOM_10320 [Escherichia coli]
MKMGAGIVRGGGGLNVISIIVRARFIPLAPGTPTKLRAKVATQRLFRLAPGTHLQHLRRNGAPGLSRWRGNTLTDFIDRPINLRFIPAGAGTPRFRFLSSFSGLSPLARGTRVVRPGGRKQVAVYSRWRGEHIFLIEFEFCRSCLSHWRGEHRPHYICF